MGLFNIRVLANNHLGLFEGRSPHGGGLLIEAALAPCGFLGKGFISDREMYH